MDMTSLSDILRKERTLLEALTLQLAVERMCLWAENASAAASVTADIGQLLQQLRINGLERDMELSALDGSAAVDRQEDLVTDAQDPDFIVFFVEHAAEMRERVLGIENLLDSSDLPDRRLRVPLIGFLGRTQVRLPPSRSSTELKTATAHVDHIWNGRYRPRRQSGPGRPPRGNGTDGPTLRETPIVANTAGGGSH
ncbi:hypothetical protein ACSVHC_00680 [Arthrobacter sp. KNU-44]|uniref:hypothetical protein n=1 Tax=Arthrobacter sp. KNU-44 TaxID=3450744 RepID=UPI003F427B54